MIRSFGLREQLKMVQSIVGTLEAFFLNQSLLTSWLFLDLDWNQAQPMPAATPLWKKAV